MTKEMRQYLEETFLLDYNHLSIRSIIDDRGWKGLDEHDRINRIYLFVRDEILFGYNRSDDIKASEVLKDGYGQCNTKSTLLMALFRAVNIPCRFHGFTIDKALQKGSISGIWYRFAPKNIVHGWVEVNYKNRWYDLEGVILDKGYLKRLQEKNKDCTGTFCGFGVYTDDLQDPEIDWDENDTYIQRLGINQDLGIFNSPDEFYEKHQQDLSPLKKHIYDIFVRRLMNRNISRIRNG